MTTILFTCLLYNEYNNDVRFVVTCL